MFYVYLLKSLKNPNKTYVGFTINIKERLQKHNEGGSVYTADHKPWKLVSLIGFDEEFKDTKNILNLVQDMPLLKKDYGNRKT